MRTCLIKPHGFLGDTLFAASAARKLKQEGQFDVVDMAVGLAQAEELLQHDPYLDNILRVVEPTITPLHGVHIDGYDAEFELAETTKLVPPPMQFQLECGARAPDTKFEVHVMEAVDSEVRQQHPEPYIAVMEPTSWREKAFRFTTMEYARGEDVPYLGYGGRLRDIVGIIHRLEGAEIPLVTVGLKAGVKSLQVTQALNSAHCGGAPFGGTSIEWDAAVIKNARLFIGAEGGLANVAAGVHTQTVLTSDFVFQLYGWNGVIKHIIDPKLGPRFYWPEDGHIDLSPYLEDGQVADEIVAVFNGVKTADDYSYEWVLPS